MEKEIITTPKNNNEFSPILSCFHLAVSYNLVSKKTDNIYERSSIYIYIHIKREKKFSIKNLGFIKVRNKLKDKKMNFKQKIYISIH